MSAGSVLFSHTKGTDFDDRGIDYLAGQKLHYTLSGIGMTLQYDSRDFIPAPERGTFLMVKQVIYPKGLGNSGKTLYKTTATADYYQRLWRGAVLATDIFGEFNSSGMPWCMLAELGGGYRMRGYYLGRYIDNNILSCQIEYRQRIWAAHRLRRVGRCGQCLFVVRTFPLGSDAAQLRAGSALGVQTPRERAYRLRFRPQDQRFGFQY